MTLEQAIASIRVGELVEATLQVIRSRKCSERH
jgi:predicted membrane GTPase involved in stress response